MKKKRLFSMLFTVLLCAVPLAGCSSGENEKTPAVTGEAGQEKNDGGGNPAPSGSPNDNAENPGSEDNAGGAGQEDSEDGSSADNKIEIVPEHNNALILKLLQIAGHIVHLRNHGLVQLCALCERLIKINFSLA